MPKRTSEWQGDAPNTVTELGPNGRKLDSSEKLRLGYLTGQDSDPSTKAKTGFFYGVDPDYPEADLHQ